MMNHKSIEHMWKVVMDKDRSNHVGLPLFLEGCKALGYEDEEEVKELFEHLLLRGGSRNLSVEDIVFLQSWEKNKAKEGRKETPWSTLGESRSFPDSEGLGPEQILRFVRK